MVRERQYLADALARYMAQLGMSRRARPLPALHDYIATKDGNGKDGSEPGSES